VNTAVLTRLTAILLADEPVMVVLDNAGYHGCHAGGAIWRRKDQRFQPYFLPTYAPQIDVIERV
jgi:hypothetical protein